MEEDKGKVLAFAAQYILKELQHEFLDFLSKVQIDEAEQFQSQLFLEIPFWIKHFQYLTNCYKSFPVETSPKFMNSLLNYQNDVVMEPTFNDILVLKLLFLIAESIPKRENSKFLSAILTQMIFESCLKTPDFSELLKAELSLLMSYSKDGIDISSIFFHRLPNFITNSGSDIQYYFKFLPTIISTPNAFFECIQFLTSFYQNCKTSQKDLRPLFYKHTSYFLIEFAANYSTVRQQLFIEADKNTEKSLIIYQLVALIIESDFKDIHSYPILSFLIPLCTTQFINQMNLRTDKKKRITITDFINTITHIDKKKIIILYHVISILFTSILINPSIPFPNDVKEKIQKKFVSLLNIESYTLLINKELGSEGTNTEDSFDQYSKKKRSTVVLAALPLLENINHHFASCPLLLHLNQNSNDVLNIDILFCESVALIFNDYPIRWQKKSIPIFIGKRLIDLALRTLNTFINLINLDPQNAKSFLKTSPKETLLNDETSSSTSSSNQNVATSNNTRSPTTRELNRSFTLPKSTSNSLIPGTLFNPQSEKCSVLSRLISNPNFTLFLALMNALFSNISEIEKQVSFDTKQVEGQFYFCIKDTPIRMQILIESFQGSNDFSTLTLAAFDLLKDGIDFQYIFTFLQNFFLPYKKWESIIKMDNLYLFELISVLMHDLYEACYIFIKLDNLLSISYLISFYDTFLNWIYLVLSNATVSSEYNTQITKIAQAITDIGGLVLAVPSNTFDDKINKSYLFREKICEKWEIEQIPDIISESALSQLLHLAFSFLKKGLLPQNAFRIYFKNAKAPQNDFVRLTLKRLQSNQITDSILPSFHSIPNFYGPCFFSELSKLTHKIYFDNSNELLLLVKFAIILVTRSEFNNNMMTLAYNFVYLLQVNQFRDDELIITVCCEFFQALFANHKITTNYEGFVYLLSEELPYFSVQKKKTIVSAILNSFNSIFRSVQVKSIKLISFVFTILENCYFDFIEDKHIEKTIFSLLTNLLVNNFHFGYSLFFERMKKCDVQFRKMLMAVISTTFDSQMSLKSIECIDKSKNIYVVKTPQFVFDFSDLKFSSVLYFESVITFLSFYDLNTNFLKYMTNKENHVQQKQTDHFLIAMLKTIFFDLDYQSLYSAFSKDDVDEFVALFINNNDFIQLAKSISNSFTKIQLVLDYLLIPFLLHPTEYDVNQFSNESTIQSFIERVKHHQLLIDKVNDENQPIIERNRNKISYSKSLKKLSLFYAKYSPIDQYELDNAVPNFLPEHYIELKKSNLIYPLNEKTWMISIRKFPISKQIDPNTISEFILMHLGRPKTKLDLICDFAGCTNSKTSFLQINHFTAVFKSLTDRLVLMFENIYFHHTPATQLDLCEKLFLNQLRNKIQFVQYFSSISSEFAIFDSLTAFSIDLDYDSKIQFNEFMFDIILMRDSNKGKLPAYYSFSYSSIKSIVAENNKLNILIDHSQCTESTLTNIPKPQPSVNSMIPTAKPISQMLPRHLQTTKKLNDTFVIQLQLSHCDEVYKLLHWKQECTRMISKSDQISVFLRPFSPEFLLTQSLMYLNDPYTETQTAAFYIFNTFINEINKNHVDIDNGISAHIFHDDDNNEKSTTMKRSPSKSMGLNIFYSTKFHNDNCLCTFRPKLLLIAQKLLKYNDWQNLFYGFLSSFIRSASVKQLSDYSEFISFLSNHLTDKLSISKIVNLLIEFHCRSKKESMTLIDVFWPYITNSAFILMSLNSFFKSSLDIDVQTISRIVSILTINDTSMLLSFLSTERSFLIVQNAILGHFNISNDLIMEFFFIIIEDEIRHGEFLKTLIYMMSLTNEIIRQQYEIIKNFDEFHSSTNFLKAIEVIMNCCFEINKSNELKNRFSNASKPYQLFARSFLFHDDRNTEHLVYKNLQSIRKNDINDRIYEIIEVSMATLMNCNSVNYVTNFWISVFALQFSGTSEVIHRIQSSAINMISSIFRKDALFCDNLLKKTFTLFKGRNFLTPFENITNKFSSTENNPPFAVFLLKIFSPLLLKVNSTQMSLEFFKYFYEGQNLSNENVALMSMPFIAFHSNSPFSSQIINASKCILSLSKTNSNRISVYNYSSISSDYKINDFSYGIEKRISSYESSSSFGSTFNSHGNLFSSFNNEFGSMIMLTPSGKTSYIYDMMKKANTLHAAIDFFVFAISIPHANPQMNDIVDFFLDVLMSENELRKTDPNFKSILNIQRCRIIVSVLNNFILRDNNLHLCEKSTKLLAKLQKMMNLNQVVMSDNEFLIHPLNWSDEDILLNIESLFTNN